MRLRGTNFCTSSERFAPSFVRQLNGPKCTQMVQNKSLGSNGVDRVRLLRKILTRHRGTNFCTSSKRFPPTFARQPNGCKCTKTVQNAPKHEFKGPIGWIGCVRRENNPTRLRGTNFCTSSACFAPSFVRQSNGHKCIQIVRNALKHEFRVAWGGPGAFVAKNPDTTLWHELLQ